MSAVRRVVAIVFAAAAWSAIAEVASDAARTNHDFFDLRCAAAAGDARVIALHVDVSAEGQFDVAVEADGLARHPDVATYTNAVMWDDGGARFVLDRSTGDLTIRPPGAVLHCEKTGGRRF